MCLVTKQSDRFSSHVGHVLALSWAVQLLTVIGEVAVSCRQQRAGCVRPGSMALRRFRSSRAGWGLRAQVARDTWASSDSGSLLAGGAAVNSYRLGSSPCAIRGSGAGGLNGGSTVLEGLQAKPVSSTAARRAPISGAAADTLSAAAAVQRATLAAEGQPAGLCYMVNLAVSWPAAAAAAGAVPGKLPSSQPCWRWVAGGSTTGPAKTNSCAGRAFAQGSGRSTAQAVFSACQHGIHFLQQQAAAAETVGLAASACSSAFDSPSSGGKSTESPAAALAAMVKTAASEAQTVRWSTLVHDASGDSAASVADAYGGHTSAGQHSTPQLTSAAASSTALLAASVMEASAGAAQQLTGGSGRHLMGCAAGTVAVAGGLGGLGTLVAASVSGSSSGDSCSTALLLLGRSGRSTSSATLQVRWLTSFSIV